MIAAVKELVAGPSREWPVGREQIRWGVPAVVACLVAAQVFAMIWFTVAAGMVYRGDALPDLASRPIWTLLLFTGGLWISYFVAPILLHRLTASGPLVDFDLRAGVPQILVAAAIGVGFQLALLPALYWFVVRIMSGDPSRTAQAIADRVDNGFDALLLIVAVVVVAPIVEEWFYRGLLLPTLARRFGVVGGAFGSAVVFALVHQEPILLPGLFVLALALAWLTIRTGRIGPAIVAHVAFNATTVVQLLLF